MNTPSTSVNLTGCWFKSSFSNPSQACVEVKFENNAVCVRDSKDQGTGPVLTIPAEHWPSLLGEVTGRVPAGSNQAIRITARADGSVDLQALLGTAITLSYTPDEWTAFVKGILDGQFDLPHAFRPAT
jgi:hypothetical protein